MSQLTPATYLFGNGLQRLQLRVRGFHPGEINDTVWAVAICRSSITERRSARQRSPANGSRGQVLSNSNWAKTAGNFARLEAISRREILVDAFLSECVSRIAETGEGREGDNEIICRMGTRHSMSMIRPGCKMIFNSV